MLVAVRVHVMQVGHGAADTGRRREFSCRGRGETAAAWPVIRAGVREGGGVVVLTLWFYSRGL